MKYIKWIQHIKCKKYITSKHMLNQHETESRTAKHDVTCPGQKFLRSHNHDFHKHKKITNHITQNTGLAFAPKYLRTKISTKKYVSCSQDFQLQLPLQLQLQLQLLHADTNHMSCVHKTFKSNSRFNSNVCFSSSFCSSVGLEEQITIYFSKTKFSPKIKRT